MLDEFLARFYQTISFGPGKPFPAGDFRALFRPDALLLEWAESGYTSKSVEEHNGRNKMACILSTAGMRSAIFAAVSRWQNAG